MKIVVLDGAALDPGDLTWQGMERLGTLVRYDRTPEPLIVPRIGDAEIIITNKTPLTAQTIQRCPNIRYIGALSTGYNVIDISAAAERGVPVTNVPDYGTDAVAQHVFALLLEICNHVALHADSVRRGDWVKSADFCYWKAPLTELAGKTMGLVGFGKIGRRTARLAEAFGMRTLAYSRRPQTSSAPAGTAFVPLQTLLAQSDIVSLHCPLTDRTHHLINDDTLRQCKPGAILINTARGPLVDHAAVAHALHSGQLSYYVADVAEHEPMAADDPLLGAPRCLFTPHIAWAARESRQRLMDMAAENIQAFLRGTPQNVVNGGKKD
ncbi:MAG: D-2-hydroxyacid dehydrogenase [Christensenellales bacterium]